MPVWSLICHNRHKIELTDPPPPQQKIIKYEGELCVVLVWDSIPGPNGLPPFVFLYYSWCIPFLTSFCLYTVTLSEPLSFPVQFIFVYCFFA
jgi:hypothetical protein